MAVLLIGAAAAVLILLLNRRSRRRAFQTWCDKTRGDLDAAVLVERLLPAAGGDDAPTAHWDAVRTRVTEAADLLERSAAKAPTSEARRAASDCATALRGAVFAVEAERLLRAGTRAPTAGELADADIAIRQSSTAVRESLDGLGAVIDSSRPAERN